RLRHVACGDAGCRPMKGKGKRRPAFDEKPKVLLHTTLWRTKHPRQFLAATAPVQMIFWEFYNEWRRLVAVRQALLAPDYRQVDIEHHCLSSSFRRLSSVKNALNDLGCKERQVQHHAHKTI